MKKLQLLLIGLVLFNATWSQQASLKGNITDTVNKQQLSNAVICLLNSSDSTLYKFIRSNSNGEFEFSNLKKGKYIILVSYPSYADYFDTLSLQENSNIEYGKVMLTTKVHLLEDVIVRQKVAAIRMKGDTLEFKADSFKVSANANVQDLLKKLPGITVNNKGEITAQGQKVQKVLVDGEEFFSDDPAVVTQNLRADAVDKLQVFDKKSDQANFTGIDDGEKIKTINLQLKEDKKKGYFGKVEAGTDFDRYKYGKALVNSFKGKRKFAAYITGDNTKYESLDWNERRNYSEDMNSTTQVNDDGGISIWSTGDDFSWGQGFPQSITGGLHFSNKWNKDKHNSINTYQFNDLQVNGLNSSITQTLLPDSTFFVNNTTQTFNNQKRRNRIRSTYDWQIDSTSSLKIIATGSIITSKADNNFTGNSINSKGILLNESLRRTISNSEDQNLIANIIWRKRFKKKGRTLSFNSDISLLNKNNNGFLFASNNFYSGTPGTFITDQLKTTEERLNGISGKVAFTEAIWKNTILELNYRFAFNRNNALRNTLEGGTNGTGNYNTLIDSLSNHFVFNNNNHTAGFNFRFTKKKINFSVGTSIGDANFRLNDLRKNTARSVSFTNFLPAVSINFIPKKQTRFGFNYNGNTSNPTLQQINPIIDNIDPLNITIGNAFLKQEFRHNFRLSFSDYKVLKERNIYVSANFSFTDNAITNSNSIDKFTGQRVNQSVNVNGNYNFNVWAGYNFQVAPSFNLDLNFNPSINRFNNIIDGVKNTNDNTRIGFRIGSGYWGDKWLNYYFSLEPAYNYSLSSINANTTKYWTFNSYNSVEMKLPKKWYINLNSQITVFQKTAVFANARDIFTVNSSIKKSIDKAEKWQVAFSVNDIFNQNQQVNRNISSNFISESSQQIIQRYGLLSLAYNFSKNGKPSQGW